MVSPHNPFRTPAVTPSSTGTTSLIRNSVTAEPASQRARSPTPPPEDLPAGPSSDAPPLAAATSDPLTEDLPPAYTVAPDLRNGETTLELGPRRPFQQAPRLVPQYLSPFPTGQQSAQPSGSNWSSFPGERQTAGTSQSRLGPPPIHPSFRRDNRSRSTPNSPSTPLPASEFARDFYAAGGTSTPVCLPPDGEPPTRSAVHTSSSDPALRRNDAADDARFECPKCKNTGYKNYDPDHPCSRCWEKYARKYSPAMAYAPSAAGAQSTYQRPLPKFHAPQDGLSRHHTSKSYSGRPLLSPSVPSPSSDLSRAASTSRASGTYPGAAARIIPVAGGGVPMSPYLDHTQRASFPPASWYPASNVRVTEGRPPAGAAVVRPGDPRIGGRLCWRCGGSGVTSFFIFEEQTCTVCGGVGRTFA
ncbi:hypothetical protein A0H81_06222 [Grifola frondosa]|uniref:Uncharacterized protein n=1 Tax=Grifola frondosa TaxID=5627 RepID=A0A1C7MCJ2_GRIFR|nr:hypothetical protein A0H81_06222 [Grifola frondosa]